MCRYRRGDLSGNLFKHCHRPDGGQVNVEWLVPTAVFSTFALLHYLNGSGRIEFRGWPFADSDLPRTHFWYAALGALFAVVCLVMGLVTS
jgi:hypothetical protein